MTRKQLKENGNRYRKQKFEKSHQFPFSNFHTNFQFLLTNFLSQIMFKHKPQLKRITRAIAWLLVLTIVANIFNAFVAPRTTQAVDASDYMYLFWPTASDCSDKPSGWTVVSDGAGEAFYDATDGGLFVRGNTSYSRYAGGAPTHTHSGSGSSTAATSTDRKTAAGSTHNSTTHTHPVTVDSVSSVSSLPQYKELCVIKYDNGIPNGNSAIPSGAVAIFDAAVPSGWSDYSATFGTNFIRGGAAATGGSNTHQGTGHSVSATLTGVAGTIAKSGTTANRSSLANHTHTFSGTSNTPDTQPPYIEIYLGQKSSAGPIPNGMIGMFDDTDSSVGFSVAGWTRLSDSGGPFYQRFLKVTGSYGLTGGAAQHSHAQITGNSSSSASDTGGSGSGTIPGHTHPVTIDLADGTNTNIPPYTNIVIAKKQTDITSLTTDSGSYPTLGQTITVNSTVNNYHASTNLSTTKIDYVFFIDADADGQPDAGETYITNNCAGSGAWAAGNYTHQTTGVNVAFGGSTNDQWSCTNSNFPQNTTYTLWAEWWDGTSYAYNIYYQKGSVTFTSVPTLTEILFLALVGCAVFLGVRTGVIKIRKNGRIEPEDIKDPPNKQLPIENSRRNNHQGGRPFDYRSGFRASPSRSIDGITARKNPKS